MTAPTAPSLPHAGLRVVEFTHMVMCPTCGMVLGDLGAEVIKVDPPKGDNTRRLLGSGAGFFPLFNRNKKSLALDGQVLHAWCLAGFGIAWRSTWEVEGDLAAGRLTTVLDDFAAPPNGIYALFLQRKHLALRVRLWIDFLKHHDGQADFWVGANS